MKKIKLPKVKVSKKVMSNLPKVKAFSTKLSPVVEPGKKKKPV